MTAFYQSRRFRYEIQGRIAGRWRIEATVEDQRDGKWFGKLDLEELERNAISRANSLLASGRYEAVKVIRERSRGGDVVTATPIFEKVAPADRERPLSIGRVEGAVEPCQELVELYSRRACRVIGVVLRSFLDRLMITPLELLHLPAYMRKLTDTNNALLQAALHHVATMQTAGEAAMKARVSHLQSLIDAAERRAREGLAERKLPVLENHDLARLQARLEARFGNADSRFWVCAVLTRMLQGTNSYLGKALLLLPCLDKPLPNELREFIDEWIAGCADSSQFVMDALGRRDNLAGALMALADLAEGKLEDVSPDAAPLVAALARGDLPLTAETFWERIERELQRGRPLGRDDAKAEWALVLRISDHLVPRVPASRRDVCEAAVARRLDRLREDAVV
jgi:hypothetical protein